MIITWTDIPAVSWLRLFVSLVDSQRILYWYTAYSLHLESIVSFGTADLYRWRSWASVYSVKLVYGHDDKGLICHLWRIKFLICIWVYSYSDGDWYRPLRITLNESCVIFICLTLEALRHSILTCRDAELCGCVVDKTYTHLTNHRVWLGSLTMTMHEW